MANKPLPQPGTRPNPWSNSVVGEFTPEEHAANMPPEGVQSFEAVYGMTGSKAASILNKAGSRFAKGRVAGVPKAKPAGKAVSRGGKK